MKKLLLILSVVCAAQAAAILWAAASGRASTVDNADSWREHIDALSLVDSRAYYQDNARVFSGRVTNSQGEGLGGVAVSVLDVKGLVSAGVADPKQYLAQPFPVERTVQADKDGSYQIEGLSRGLKTFCFGDVESGMVSVAGISVEDGYGGRFNARIGASRELAINDLDDAVATIHLVPHQWWPSPLSAEVRDGSAVFSRLSGPFARGLIIGEKRDGRTEVLGSFEGDKVLRFDSGERNELLLPLIGAGTFAKPFQMSAFDIIYLASSSPMGLFLIADPNRTAKSESGSEVRGFAPRPHNPVLLESTSGKFSQLQWTSEAKEFVFETVPEGTYRIRSLTWGGESCDSAGIVVSGAKNPVVYLSASRDDDARAAVCGCVATQTGGQAEEPIEVVMQDVQDFRRYLKVKAVDKNGFYRLDGVPTGRFLIFVRVTDGSRSLRNTGSVTVTKLGAQCEHWTPLTWFSGKIQLTWQGETNSARILRVTEQGDEFVGAAVRVNMEARSTVSNVRPGNYKVQCDHGTHEVSVTGSETQRLDVIHGPIEGEQAK